MCGKFVNISKYTDRLVILLLENLNAVAYD